jgi:hypothetical protein
VEEPTITDLAEELLTWGEATHESARRTLRVVSSDPELGGAVHVPSACAEARVLGLERDGGGRLAVAVRSPAACPLVLARNYATSVTASAGDGAPRLRVFPAYGALLGVLVPPGTERVEVRPEAWPPRYGLPAFLAGVAVLAALLRGRT